VLVRDILVISRSTDRIGLAEANVLGEYIFDRRDSERPQEIKASRFLDSRVSRKGRIPRSRKPRWRLAALSRFTGELSASARNSRAKQRSERRLRMLGLDALLRKYTGDHSRSIEKNVTGCCWYHRPDNATKDPRGRMFVWIARLVAGRHPLNPRLIILSERPQRGDHRGLSRDPEIFHLATLDERNARFSLPRQSSLFYAGFTQRTLFYTRAEELSIMLAHVACESRQAAKASLPRIVCDLCGVCHAF